MNESRFFAMTLLRLGLMWALVVSPSAFGQKEKSSAASPDSSQMTLVMDGGAGPCSLELSVSANGKPTIAAHVWVHIVYGFGGIRKLDLDAYTGNDGKLKFTGLPDRVKRPLSSSALRKISWPEQLSTIPKPNAKPSSTWCSLLKKQRKRSPRPPPSDFPRAFRNLENHRGCLT
jgi:hypothetical protein